MTSLWDLPAEIRLDIVFHTLSIDIRDVVTVIDATKYLNHTANILVLSGLIHDADIKYLLPDLLRHAKAIRAGIIDNAVVILRSGEAPLPAKLDGLPEAEKAKLVHDLAKINHNKLTMKPMGLKQGKDIQFQGMLEKVLQDLRLSVFAVHGYEELGSRFEIPRDEHWVPINRHFRAPFLRPY